MDNDWRLKIIELNALPVYDDRYIKTKIKTYDDNFHSLNVPEDDIVCESLTVISIESLLVYKNKYFASLFRQLCL